MTFFACRNEPFSCRNDPISYAELTSCRTDQVPIGVLQHVGDSLWLGHCVRNGYNMNLVPIRTDHVSCTCWQCYISTVMMLSTFHFINTKDKLVDPKTNIGKLYLFWHNSFLHCTKKIKNISLKIKYILYWHHKNHQFISSQSRLFLFFLHEACIHGQSQ